MEKNNNPKATQLALALATIAIAVLLIAQFAIAVPSGASVTFVSQSQAGSGSAGNRSDAGGTITTIILNATSQNGFWKAYVGNVTGALTLDDANGFTIYDWSLNNVTISGEVYTTRNSGVDFTAMECANGTTITTEESFLGMTAGTPDSINGTFNYSVHSGFSVGSTSISNSTCQSTFTYVNDVAQASSETADFQEILLQDNQSILVYTTLIENDATGYDGTNTFDFQMLVGNHNNATAVTYYFYTEISTS